MALITNTKTVYGLGPTAGAREDLEDTIWDLYPDDTYLLSNLDRVKVSSTFHEWMSDNLAAATTNAQLDGDDATFSDYTASTRYGNYTQIFRKTFIVSGSAEATSYAGRKSEVARQVMKQMRELKNDIEYNAARNNESSAGGAGTARQMGAMESWIASTDNAGNGTRTTSTASCSTAAYSSGLTGAPTDGTTTSAVTEALFKATLALAWADGGDPSTVLVGTAQKTAIGAFSGVATKYNEIKGARAAVTVGSVDMFVSDVGNHSIVLHRHVRPSVILCIDPSMWAFGFLRSPQMTTLAQSGDGIKRMLIAEGTLICRNPNASAKIAGCA